MASAGYVKSLINGIESSLLARLEKAFDHILATYRLGTDRKAANFSWFRIESTTATTANEEFSVEHGLETTPTHLIPVLDLGVVGAQLVPLTNSRAPDARRVYLKSSSTGAVFTAYVEG